MHTHHHHHSHESAGSSGPAWYYGYCHDSGQMKMMSYPEYVNNMQTTYSKTMSNPGWAMQQWSDSLQGKKGAGAHKSGCGCHEREGCGCGCDLIQPEHAHAHCVHERVAAVAHVEPNFPAHGGYANTVAVPRDPGDNVFE